VHNLSDSKVSSDPTRLTAHIESSSNVRRNFQYSGEISFKSLFRHDRYVLCRQSEFCDFRVLGMFFFVFASVTLDQSLFSSIDVVPLVALLDVRVSVPSNLGLVQRRTFRTCKLVRLPFPSGSGLGPS